MNNLFARVKEWVGLNEPVEYEYEYDEEVDGQQYRNVYQQQQQQPVSSLTAGETSGRTARPSRLRERAMANTNSGIVSPLNTSVSMNTESSTGIGSVMNNVIGMPGSLNGISEVVVMEPRSFEEMPQAIRALKERKSVVLNLTMMDPDQAQRSVDFVAGGTYALDGHQERVGESIFLFTPSCVQVRTQTGVVHEVAQAQARPRVATGAGAWQGESIQAMQ